MGSFVPWLYYSFYCSPQPCVVYLIVVCVLGLAAITVSQCDFFATPQYRGVRAGEQSHDMIYSQPQNYRHLVLNVWLRFLSQMPKCKYKFYLPTRSGQKGEKYRIWRKIKYEKFEKCFILLHSSIPEQFLKIFKGIETVV